jgi:hypothetical protein
MNMGRSDAELLEASKRGEHAAFGTLVERYQNTVCAVTYSRTGNRALSEAPRRCSPPTRRATSGACTT